MCYNSSHPVYTATTMSFRLEFMDTLRGGGLLDQNDILVSLPSKLTLVCDADTIGTSTKGLGLRDAIVGYVNSVKDKGNRTCLLGEGCNKE